MLLTEFAVFPEALVAAVPAAVPAAVVVFETVPAPDAVVAGGVTDGARGGVVCSVFVRTV